MRGGWGILHSNEEPNNLHSSPGSTITVKLRMSYAVRIPRAETRNVFESLVRGIPKIQYFLEDQGIRNERNTTRQSTAFIVVIVTTAP